MAQTEQAQGVQNQSQPTDVMVLAGLELEARKLENSDLFQLITQYSHKLKIITGELRWRAENNMIDKDELNKFMS